MLLAIKKRFILVAALIICCSIFIFLSIGNNADLDVSSKIAPIKRVNINENKIALLIDGLDKDKLLDLSAKLKSVNAQSAFSVHGLLASSIGKKIENNGSIIINHSNTHSPLNKMPIEQIKLEFSASKAALEGISNNNYFFPPYGTYNENILNTCITNALLPIYYDVNANDWAGEKEVNIAKKILKKCQKGSIVYFDLDKIAPDKIINVIKEIQKKKWTIVRLDQLILKENYKVDNNGVQNLN